MGYIHVCIHAYGFHMRVCMYIVSPLAGLGGGILWRPPAYSLLKLIITIDFHIFNMYFMFFICNLCYEALLSTR